MYQLLGCKDKCRAHIFTATQRFLESWGVAEHSLQKAELLLPVQGLAELYDVAENGAQLAHQRAGCYPGTVAPFSCWNDMVGPALFQSYCHVRGGEGIPDTPSLGLSI
jgi:hypothetical protein